MNIWLPTLDQILLIHERLLLHTGGASGIRDIRLIESALARATSGYGGIEAHPGLIAKAAAICCGLTQNHGFVDGNKRIGITTMLLILQKNAMCLSYTQDELIQLGLGIAQNQMDVEDIVRWIELHIVT